MCHKMNGYHDYDDQSVKIEVKVASIRKVHASINDVETHIRRGTINTKENCVLFTEKNSKAILKFNPLNETFDANFYETRFSNPFCVKYLRVSDRYLVGDLDGPVIKLVDCNFNLLKVFVATTQQLEWPYDIEVNRNESLFYVSDFKLNKLCYFHMNLDSNETTTTTTTTQESNLLDLKFNEHMPLDLKVNENRLFIVDSCSFDAFENKLVSVDNGGNSIHVVDCVSGSTLNTISDQSLLHPQGLYIDDLTNYVYTIGLLVDEDRCIQPELHLFCFSADSGSLIHVQNLYMLHNFEHMISDMIVWKYKHMTKLLLNTFDKGLYIIDCEYENDE